MAYEPACDTVTWRYCTVCCTFECEDWGTDDQKPLPSIGRRAPGRTNATGVTPSPGPKRLAEWILLGIIGLIVIMAVAAVSGVAFHSLIQLHQFVEQ